MLNGHYGWMEQCTRNGQHEPELCEQEEQRAGRKLWRM
jgi:hypothetical protein